jgi:hypothetical protein
MKLFVLLPLIATMVAGCLVMVRGQLYPIQGTLSTQTPARSSLEPKVRY